jgi:hypothetical protein
LHGARTVPAPPYDRKLIKAWQRIGEGWMNISMKAATQRHASLRRMRDEPGVWEALTATLDAGKFAPEAVWCIGDFVADRMPPRFVVDVLRARFGISRKTGATWLKRYDARRIRTPTRCDVRAFRSSSLRPHEPPSKWTKHLMNEAAARQAFPRPSSS